MVRDGGRATGERNALCSVMDANGAVSTGKAASSGCDGKNDGSESDVSSYSTLENGGRPASKDDDLLSGFANESDRSVTRKASSESGETESGDGYDGRGDDGTGDEEGVPDAAGDDDIADGDDTEGDADADDGDDARGSEVRTDRVACA